MKLLASVFGKHSRQLVQTNTSSAESAHAIGFVQQGQKGLLMISKSATPSLFRVPVAPGQIGWEGTLLEGVGAEPGFTPPREIQLIPDRSDETGTCTVRAGAYAVLVLWESRRHTQTLSS